MMKKHWLALLPLVAVLAGCGGGGSLDGSGDTTGGTTTPPPTTTPTVALAVYDCPNPSAATIDGCTQVTSIDPLKPAVLLVTAKDADGNAQASKVVTVSTDKGALSPTDGKVLTDSNGEALLRYNAGTAQGVVTFDADSGDATTSVSASIGSVNVTMNLSSGAVEPVAQGASFSVRAELLANGQPYATPVPVTFTSRCVDSGQASLDNPVNTIAGVATSTYQLTGCEGQDLITVSATVGSNNLTETLTLLLSSSPVGSIAFDSANPEYINIEGSGGTRNSTVTFIVRDQNGSPKKDVPVTFGLENNKDASLEQTSAVSNASGQVSTTLISGALPSSPRVKAYITAQPNITAVSQNLAIGTGLPDTDSFSLSIENHNPYAAKINGVDVNIRIDMGDQFNNPPPDGTVVTVVTEGGRVIGNCATQQGTCSVKWTSTDPRPRDLRTTILAYTQGEESFDDLNGNGRFDPDVGGVSEFEANQDQGEPFLDLNENGVWDTHETYVDSNHNGQYDNGEVFYDFNGNGKYDGPSVRSVEPFYADGGQVTSGRDRLPPNGIYDGLLCQSTDAANGLCNNQPVDMMASGVIVFSGNNIQVLLCDGNYQNCGTPSATVTATTLNACVFDIAPDGTINPAPIDTAISFEAKTPLEISRGGSQSMPSTSGYPGLILDDVQSSCPNFARFSGYLTAGKGTGQVFISAKIGAVERVLPVTVNSGP